MKLGKKYKKIPTSRLAVFFPTRPTGNDFLLKGGLNQTSSGLEGGKTKVLVKLVHIFKTQIKIEIHSIGLAHACGLANITPTHICYCPQSAKLATGPMTRPVDLVLGQWLIVLSTGPIGQWEVDRENWEKHKISFSGNHKHNFRSFSTDDNPLGPTFRNWSRWSGSVWLCWCLISLIRTIR